MLLTTPVKVWLWLSAAACVALAPAIVRAQDTPARPGGEPREVVPPRVVSLPDVDLPEGETATEVTVRVLIDAEGHATIEGCDASESLCDAVADAMTRATFEPARRGETAIPARIAVRLEVRAAEPVASVATPSPPSQPEERNSPQTPPALRDRAAEPEDDEGFSARARVERPVPGVRRLTLAETRDLPGAFGDPFRAIDALPGVTPVLSGLPYFYVRGAPPSGTLYVYDDVPVPALYHLAAGPAVVHPRMVGPVRLHSGVPPARYGRLTGGAIVGEGPDAPEGESEGELELRLLDISGYASTPIGPATVSVAGRYGYPGLLLSIFSPEVDLAYWDYQTRVDLPLSSHDALQLVWFGSYDSLTQTEEPYQPEPPFPGDPLPPPAEPNENRLTLQFHRAELRYIRHVGALTFGSALRIGFEESSLYDGTASDHTELAVRFATLGPRLWLTYRDGPLRVRIGSDLIASSGEIDAPLRELTDDDTPNDSVDPEIEAVPGRAVGGVYAEVGFRPFEELALELGVRGDLWMVGGGYDGAIDPRVRAILTPTPGLDLHIAGGVTRQPAVFFVPLPGLSEIALDFGLQTAIQAEAGVGYDVLEDLRAEAQVFVHRYQGLVFTDLFFNQSIDCGSAYCGENEIDPRVDGTSYGGELFIRRPPGLGDISGFLSYTLAWSEIDDDATPYAYTPSYDIRHVLNAVALIDFGGGWTAGARVHVRSGKPLGYTYADVEQLAVGRYEQRLPVFFRLDAQFAYSWETSWGRMRFQLEFFNTTLSREPLGIDCYGMMGGAPTQECKVEYGPPIFFPNLGLRAEL